MTLPAPPAWRLLAAGLACIATLPAATAAEPSFSASVSGYTALSQGPITEALQVPMEVTASSGPLRADAAGEGGRLVSYPTIDPNSLGFASTFARGSASASPGVLHVYGGVRSVATDAQNRVTGQLLPSSFHVRSQVSVSASFADTVTVEGHGLALGTAVQLPVNYLAELVSNYPLGYPPFSVHALSAYAAFNLTGMGSQQFSTESGFFPWTQTTVAPGVSRYVVRSSDFSITAHVGDVLDVSAVFGVQGLAAISDLQRQTDVGGYVDGGNTAAIWFGALPDGVTLRSASGHDYRLDPTAAVPEPQSALLMLGGLGGLGLLAAARRRKAPAA